MPPIVNGAFHSGDVQKFVESSVGVSLFIFLQHWHWQDTMHLVILFLLNLLHVSKPESPPIAICTTASSGPGLSLIKPRYLCCNGKWIKLYSNKILAIYVHCTSFNLPCNLFSSSLSWQPLGQQGQQRHRQMQGLSRGGGAGPPDDPPGDHPISAGVGLGLGVVNGRPHGS